MAEGPLFRSVNRHRKVRARRLSPADVAPIVKKLAKQVGLDPAEYAGHSVRAGHATSAPASGATERSIMNHGAVTLSPQESVVWIDLATLSLQLSICPRLELLGLSSPDAYRYQSWSRW